MHSFKSKIDIFHFSTNQTWTRKLEDTDANESYHHAKFEAERWLFELTMRFHDKEGVRDKEGGMTVCDNE